MKKRNKRAQGSVFGMSFGVIFSIILIVFIIVVAGIVIKVFLNTGDCTRIVMFLDENDKTSFRFAVNRAWKSSGMDFDYSGNLPASLEYVCFANLSDRFKGEWADLGDEIDVYDKVDNLFLLPIDEACNNPSHKVQHLNITKITDGNNPYCIVVDSGKVIIRIEKGVNQGLVSLS